MKPIILCVDDFGLKPEINEAVAELVDLGVVSATGCMSQAPAWRQGASLLTGARRNRLDVGLHFNLTQPFASGPGSADAHWARPLSQIIGLSMVGGLSAQVLHRAVCSQLDDFEDAWGAAPDFVDGHQHVHQLPQVRRALLAELQRRYGALDRAARPWLRATRPRPGAQGASLKERIIEALGARRFEREAREAGFLLNGALLGVYGFDADEAAYAQRLRDWLSRAKGADVLMMHPAKPRLGGQHTHAATEPDAIAHAREVEYTVLRDWGAPLMAEFRVHACRMRGCSSMLPD